MKTVILVGGRGQRLQELTKYVPKPMIRIGSKPILWHIMRIYAEQGFTEFILTLGYRGDEIRKWLSKDNDIPKHWIITCLETGENSQTGSRIKKLEDILKGEKEFFVTYGDGLSDINLQKLLEFHYNQKTIGTLTSVIPQSNFGIVEADDKNIVTKFIEKPKLFNNRINGGFYVFKRSIFDYLSEKEDCILETIPLHKLVENRQLSMFKHEGFWKAMDTYKDSTELNEMWLQGERKWVIGYNMRG